MLSLLNVFNNSLIYKLGFSEDLLSEMYTFTLGYFIFLNWKMQNHSQMKISRSYLVHVKGIIDLINVLVGFLIQTLQTQECLKFMQCLQAGWIFHHKFFVPHVGLFSKNAV